MRKAGKNMAPTLAITRKSEDTTKSQFMEPPRAEAGRQPSRRKREETEQEHKFTAASSERRHVHPTSKKEECATIFHDVGKAKCGPVSQASGVCTLAGSSHPHQVLTSLDGGQNIKKAPNYGEVWRRGEAATRENTRHHWGLSLKEREP